MNNESHNRSLDVIHDSDGTRLSREEERPGALRRGEVFRSRMEIEVGYRGWKGRDVSAHVTRLTSAVRVTV